MERLSGLDADVPVPGDADPPHARGRHHGASTRSTMPGGYSFEQDQGLHRRRASHLVPPFTPPAHGGAVPRPPPDLGRGPRLRPRLPRPPDRGARPRAVAASSARSPARSPARQLDRSRPLWELWVVEGLKHGRVGIVTKVHHSAIDGASGAELMVHLFDLEPGVADPPPPEPRARAHPDRHRAARLRRRVAGAAQPRARSRCIGSTLQSVGRVVQGRRAPEHLVGAMPLTAPACAVERAARPAPPGRPRPRLPRRREGVKNRFGVTVNDVVLGLVGGTLRRYLESHGDLPDEPLLAVCPVSVRADDDTQRRQPRVGHVHLARHRRRRSRRAARRRSTRSRRGAKEEHNAVGADMLQNWAEFAGPEPVQPGGAPLLEPRPGRQPPADPQRDHLQRARARLPAVLRGRRAGGGLPDGTGDGGRAGSTSP